MNKTHVALCVNMAVGCRPTEPKAEWPLTIGNPDPWLSDYFIRGRDIGKTRSLSLNDLELRMLAHMHSFKWVQREIILNETERARLARKSFFWYDSYK